SQITPEGMRVVRTVPGRSPIEIGVRAGSLLNFHSSAQGKAALAFSSEEFRARVLRGRVAPFTPCTIADPAVPAAALEKLLAQGWATAPNEMGVGLNTLAAPIFDSTGAVCGTVGIVDMVQFIGETPSEQQLSRTVAAAQRVSKALGHGEL